MIKLYTIFDKKMELHQEIIVSQNVSTVTRTIGEAANDPKSILCRHSTDYSLWEIGEYNQETGTIEAREKPHFVTNISELKTKEITNE